MKIAFLLFSPDISGGSYVIFQHAIKAMNLGMSVTMITEERFDEDILNWHPESKRLNWKIYSDIVDVEYDITIATFWRTVFELHKIQSKKYVYFVQSIESKFYDNEEESLRALVDSTYLLDLIIITEATWIQEYLKTNYNLNSYLVFNGIRKDIYKIEGEKEAERTPDKLRVLVEGPVHVHFKNVKKTIELCKRSNCDEIWLLTSSEISSYQGVDRVYSKVPIFETPKIYRSCDVVVKLSYVEGMFGPPLEIFHCGGTSITYDVTGHDEYIKHDVNGLVVPRDADELVVKYINDLKVDRDKLDLLKKNAKLTAENWPSWDESSSKFLEVLEKIHLKKDSFSRKELEIKSKFYFNFYAICVQKEQIVAQQATDRWYRFGRLSRKQKIRTILKTLMKKLRP